MNQELLNLAKEIDDNEDAISDALENEDFDTASQLSQVKQQLFKRLYELSLDVPDSERPEFNEYLSSLYDVTAEQLDLLKQEYDKVQNTLREIKRGAKGRNTYSQVRGYALSSNR